MKKTYDPPLTENSNSPLFRVDRSIRLAHQRLATAIDMKRHHTSHSLAQEVIKEARESLRKADQQRELKLKDLAQAEADYQARRQR
jgi:hypothetical protein